MGQDLTVLQEDELRIDVHASAATRAVDHGGADRAIGELYRAIGVGRDLDRTAPRLGSLRGDGAISHHELVSSIHRDVPGIATLRARSRNRSSIAKLNC